MNIWDKVGVTSVAGETRRDMVRNEDIWDKVGVTSMADKMRRDMVRIEDIWNKLRVTSVTGEMRRDMVRNEDTWDKVRVTSMADKMRRDMVRNEDIWDKVGVTSAADKMRRDMMRRDMVRNEDIWDKVGVTSAADKMRRDMVRNEDIWDKVGVTSEADKMRRDMVGYEGGHGFKPWKQPLAEIHDDNGSSKLGKENEVGELVDHHLIRSEKLLVTARAQEDSDNLVVQGGSGDGNEGSSRSGYGDFTGTQIEVDLDLSNQISDAIEGKKGDSVTNDIIDMNCLVDKTLGCNDQMIQEPGNRCSTHESEVKEPDPIRQVELDKEPSIADVRATIESCFGADAVVDLSQPAELPGQKMDVSETHLSEELKHGLRIKEMELETLISSAGATDSSVHVPVCEEVEEGEAFGDVMVFDESDYDILNNIGNEKKDGADESPANIFGKEEFAFDVHVNAPQKKDAHVNAPQKKDVYVNAQQKKDAYASSSINAVDEDNTSLGGEFIRKFREVPKDNTEKVFRSKDVETRKVCVYDTILDSGIDAEQVGGDVKLDHPAGSQFDSTSSVNAKKRKYLEVGAENGTIGKNEKKKRPSNKERKARKKAKERIKRAEKLGVKRLKLPLVVKPKEVKYCRHYIQGRCFEADKCKFSHDTIPLTKTSKPCRHFARQSCMKGDDCPFDHQLSKYPCEKYASQGFCNRGGDCLFSHEISAKTATVTSPTASNPPSAPSKSNSLIQVDTYGMSHKDVNSTSGSAALVPGKSAERSVLECVGKPAARAPKGVRLFSGVTLSSPRGKSLQGDAEKHKEADLSSKADDVGKFKSESNQKLNGFMKGTSVRTPQGVNFLSFGRAPLAEPSRDTLTSMLNMDYGVDKLQLGDMNNSKEAATCSKRNDSVKDDNQANVSAKLRSMNQMSTRNPPGSVPRGVNILSVDKAVKNRLHPNDFNSASSPIQRRQNALNTTSTEMPFRQLSSLFPSGQSLIQSAQKCNAEVSSSSKAPLLANTTSSIQKALSSTLAFAANLEVKYGMPNGSPDISSAINNKAGSSRDR
ncbi:hypothetical protein BC332_27177 [Capsicum chinense]|nr:hypothetical protein BC332_27177 [Capsicum chinense]